MDHLFVAAAGYGNFINGLKFLPIIIITIGWLRLLTWVDKDSTNAHLPRETVNMINLGGWALAFALTLIMPNYLAALGVFLLLFFAEVGYYLIWRNQTVGLADLSDEIKKGFSSFGGKKKEKEVKATEGALALMDRGGKAVIAPPDEDPSRPAFDALQSLLQGPMKLGAQRIDLRPVEGGSVQRYNVDGVTFEGRSFPRELASAAVEYAKVLAGMDVSDRRKPQTGKMKVGTEHGKHDLDVYTAGSTAGELMRMQVDVKKQYEQRIDTLGLLPDQHEQLLNAIAEPAGVVLLTAPDGQGQTNLAYAVLRKHDAFLSQILTLEREPAAELEGVRHNKLPNGAPAAEEAKQIEWLVSQEPDVIFLDRCDDPRSAIDLARYAENGKRAYITMRAPTTFDALAQWRKLIGDDTLAMNSLKLIVAERLIRVLCPACKIAYTPDPEALRKMNMAADRISTLYQARKEPMRDQKGNEVICPFCHGLAYKGRTGVFELFRVDDEVRKAVLAGGTVNQLKALFRKQRQRYLQEAALARVEMGDTSVEEVLRVLRSQASTSQTKRPAAQ